MTKKLSRGFSDFFMELSITELRRLMKMDWPEIIRRAKEFNGKYECCPNCGEKEQEYSCDIKKISKIRYNFFLEHFCSLNCLQRFLDRNIKNDKLHHYSPYLGPGLRNKVIHNLVWCLEQKELKKLNKKQILALTKERIKNYEDAQKCTYCGKKDQKLRFDIFEVTKNTSRGIAFGDFCSKKCLKKYVKKL